MVFSLDAKLPVIGTSQFFVEVKFSLTPISYHGAFLGPQPEI